MNLVILMAAVAANRVIGRNGSIPWHCGPDLKRFKRLTMGFPLIMGRKTWESLPARPLPGRENIVLSNGPEFTAEGAAVFRSLEKALEHCSEKEKVFIIGGAEIFKLAVRFAGAMELTLLERQYDGDVFFPEFDAGEWLLVEKEDGEDPECGRYAFCSYVRKKKA